MAIVPAVSLAILAIASIEAIAITTLIATLLGLILALSIALPSAPEARAGRVRLAFDRSWTIPLATMLMFTGFWGLLQAYLPHQLAAYPAYLGVFLATNGWALVVLRVVSGALTSRIAPRWLIGSGAAITALSIPLLITAPSLASMAVAGLLSGAGIGLVNSPVLVQLSNSSNARNRGSAFALFGVALASGLALGSVGLAPVVDNAGFEAAAVAAGVGVVAAAGLNILLALNDMRHSQTASPAETYRLD
jgi:predicted MFS family arabinose efflux permease